MTGIIEKQLFQEMIGLLPGQGLVGLMGRQLLLDGFKQALVHDRRVFPRQHFALVSDLANEEAVAKEVGEGTSAERNASAGFARRTERS
jgi:hypothetical protein